MANEKTDQEKAAEKAAAEKLAAEKKAAERPQAPAASTKTPYEIVTNAAGEETISTGHLTRDSIVQFQRAKFMEAGKSADEASELALKRGYEMVKDPPVKA